MERENEKDLCFDRFVYDVRHYLRLRVGGAYRWPHHTPADVLPWMHVQLRSQEGWPANVAFAAGHLRASKVQTNLLCHSNNK